MGAWRLAESRSGRLLVELNCIYENKIQKSFSRHGFLYHEHNEAEYLTATRYNAKNKALLKIMQNAFSLK
jgi:hypothetical protein